MTIKLDDLPYAMNALEPQISQETLEYHYGKHHQTYVTNLNNLLPQSEFHSSPLEEIVLKSKGAIYNNAAQTWNHTFYWHSLSPKGGGEPTGKLADMIVRDFSSFNNFKEEFTKAAVTQFGSGWAFLSLDGDKKLVISQEGAAGNPMLRNCKPLLTCDVWEHAYYIDYRNARAKYVESFWQLVNWQFAAGNLG
jgi:Fe-Mn family superoxide dismutase